MIVRHNASRSQADLSSHSTSLSRYSRWRQILSPQHASVKSLVVVSETIHHHFERQQSKSGPTITPISLFSNPPTMPPLEYCNADPYANNHTTQIPTAVATPLLLVFLCRLTKLFLKGFDLWLELTKFRLGFYLDSFCILKTNVRVPKVGWLWIRNRHIFNTSSEFNRHR